MAGSSSQTIFATTEEKTISKQAKKPIKTSIDSNKLKTISPPKQTLQTLSVPPSFFAKAVR
jgi:hypothetical protein